MEGHAGVWARMCGAALCGTGKRGSECEHDEERPRHEAHHGRNCTPTFVQSLRDGAADMMAPMRKMAGAGLLALLLFPSPQRACSQKVKGPGPGIRFELRGDEQHPLPKVKWWSMEMVSTPPVPVIAASADRSGLFALIPQDDRRWQLQRLTAWQTGSPKVERLEFDGDDIDSRWDYVRAGMTASPDGRYLVIRIFVFDQHQWKRRAVVILVDLKRFEVVWRRVIEDPLVANSRWMFIDAKRLIAVEGPPPTHSGRPVVSIMVSQDILRIEPVSPGEHEAGALTLPNLDVSFRCGYTVKAGRRGGSDDSRGG